MTAAMILFSIEDNGRLRIENAEPRTYISREFVDLARAHPTPEISLDELSPGQDLAHPRYGAILTIRAVNRTAIYRLTTYCPDKDAYLAEWPD